MTAPVPLHDRIDPSALDDPGGLGLVPALVESAGCLPDELPTKKGTQLPLWWYVVPADDEPFGGYFHASCMEDELRWLPAGRLVAPLAFDEAEEDWHQRRVEHCARCRRPLPTARR